MALRSFFALSSSSMIVTSSSSASIVGNPIINNSDTPNGTVFAFTAGTGATVTLDDTGGSVDTLDDDDESNHVITDGAGLVSNGTEVEAESLIFVRALDTGGTPTGPVITIYVFSKDGVTSDVWGFGTSAPIVSGTSYVKTGGSNIGSTPYTNIITCFAEGTLIKTNHGHVAVQDITVGQQIWTKDNGPQKVLWVATTKVRAKGAFAPVVFAPGSIGNARELVVSQHHRIMLNLPIAEVLFGSAEVFVAAKHLAGLPGISIREQDSILYTHFMFDRHQVVESDGALTESFFLSPLSVNALERHQREELLALFPSLLSGQKKFGETAVMSLKASEVAVLRNYLPRKDGISNFGIVPSRSPAQNRGRLAG